MTQPKITYVIFGLILIGLLARVMDNPQGYIIPLIVFGVILYFLKFPPKRGFRMPRWSSTQGHRPTGSKRYRKKKKQYPFRVIQGNKGDEDPPPYH